MATYRPSPGHRIRVIDSHTAGEPTRVVVSGGPELPGRTLAEKLASFRDSWDGFRSAIVNEPRGSNALVGALLCEPLDPACVAGVIFFNNVGYLGMCGHGTIGLGVTLAHLGRICTGMHKIETPVGIVGMEVHETGEISVANVASYREAAGVEVVVEGKRVAGDVAWGGNWFFLTDTAPCALELHNLAQLTDYTWQVRQAVAAAGFPQVDHVELFAAPHNLHNHSRNFVLCPGKEYDRSPCGTGTSAKLACLYADGKLRESEVWRQESVLGTVFEGSFTIRDGRIWPRIKGSAYVTAEADLVFDARDPFLEGIRG